MKSKGKKKRKFFSQGEIASLKFPVIKGPEGLSFYQWINGYEKYGYRSLNNLFIEALRLKFMMDHLKLREEATSKDINSTIIDLDQINSIIFDVEDIEMVEGEGFDTLGKTFGSIKR